MTEAVKAVVERKFGAGGVFSAAAGGAWVEPDKVAAQVPRLSDATIAAAGAYCEYVWRRYGRFPATMAPYRTVLGCQVGRIDVNFYDKFYKPGVVSERHRKDFQARTHDMAKATNGSSVVNTASKVQPSTE
jgi:hypothetical protein